MTVLSKSEKSEEEKNFRCIRTEGSNKRKMWTESKIVLDRKWRLRKVVVGKWMEREIFKKEKTGRTKSYLMSLEEKSIWFVPRKCRKRWWSCHREGNSLRNGGFSTGSSRMLVGGKGMAGGDWRSVLAGYSLQMWYTWDVEATKW